MKYYAFNLAMKQSWAILPATLQTILEIAARDNPDLEAVEAELGRTLNNTRNVGMRAGVAVIPVQGPIMRYASLFTQISGAVSIDDLAKDFNMALNSSEVKAIILNMDTPGGEVNGVAEFAAMVHAARGTKPIIAYAANMMASAGYWIGSAADEVVAQETAELGSIGVVATYRKYGGEGMDCFDGETWKDFEFVSSQSPKKHPDPNTDTGKQIIQDRMDALAAVFIRTVALHRSVSEDTVRSDFGEGGVQIAQQAVESGMANRLGSLEGLIEELSNSNQNPFTQTRTQTGVSTMTLEQLKAQHPELVTKIREEEQAKATETRKEAVKDAKEDGKTEGVIEGATAERERIKAVHSALTPGHEALVEKAMFDGKSNAGDVALEVLAAERKQRETVAGEIATDHNKPAGETSGEGADLEAKQKAAEAKAAAEVASNADTSSAEFNAKSAEDQAKAIWAANKDFEGDKPQDAFEKEGQFVAYYQNRHRIRNAKK